MDAGARETLYFKLRTLADDSSCGEETRIQIDFKSLSSVRRPSPA